MKTKNRFDVVARVYVSVEAETEKEVVQILGRLDRCSRGSPDNIEFITWDIERVDDNLVNVCKRCKK